MFLALFFLIFVIYNKFAIFDRWKKHAKKNYPLHSVVILSVSPYVIIKKKIKKSFYKTIK